MVNTANDFGDTDTVNVRQVDELKQHLSDEYNPTNCIKS